MLKIFFRCTLDIFRYIANIVKTYKKYFLDMLHIFESRKYFSGACVRNFTLLVLYTETAAERRDPVGLSICSLMSVCGLVLTYQVDTATSVDNIYSSLSFPQVYIYNYRDQADTSKMKPE